MSTFRITSAALGLLAMLSGCDEGSTEKSKPVAPAATPAVTLTVGGSVTGLSGSGLVLQLNGANDLAVTANGKFSFPKPLNKGNSYAVTVKSAPTAPIKQTCSVSQGSGNIAGAPISNIAVACTAYTYAVGGTVTGLSGKGLVLQLNGANDLEVHSNGNFIFNGVKLPDGSDYSVAIKSAPARQKCVIKPASAAFDRNTLNIATVTCSKKS